MPSKHRFRILAALGLTTVTAIAVVPQGAGATMPARHRHKHHHHHHHHHHHRPGSTTTTSTTTKPVVKTPPPTPPSTMATTTTTTRPVTPPPPPPPVKNPPPAGTCLGQTPLTKVQGTQSGRYKPNVSGHLSVDARTAGWPAVDDWPVSLTGSGSICWNGGAIAGAWSNSTPWDTFHHTGAFSFANPNAVVENVSVYNYGDAINAREGATNWTVRGAHTSFIHDDCLQNDYLGSGVIEDSLFDGCYVGVSTRPSSSNTSSDGRNNTLEMRDSLLWLQPMPTVYKGPAPGTGGFFKWDDTGRSPKLSLHDNVFRADQTPNHGSLGLPAGYSVSCSGNTIVWLGSGAFPEASSWLSKCPDTKIVTSKSTWNNAVAAWTAAH